MCTVITKCVYKIFKRGPADVTDPGQDLSLDPDLSSSELNP